MFGVKMTRKVIAKAYAMIDLDQNGKPLRVELIAFKRDGNDSRAGYEAYVNIGGDKKNGVQGTLFLSNKPNVPAKFSEVVGEMPLIDSNGEVRKDSQGQDMVKKVFGDTLLLYPKVVDKNGEPITKRDGSPAMPFLHAVSRTPEEALEYTLSRLAVKETSTKDIASREVAKSRFQAASRKGSAVSFVVTNGRNGFHLPGPDNLPEPQKKTTERVEMVV